MLNSPRPLFLDCYLGVRGNSVKILWFPKHILRFLIDGCVLTLPRKNNPDSFDYLGEQTQFARIAEKSKPRLPRSFRKASRVCSDHLGNQTKVAQIALGSEPRLPRPFRRVNPDGLDHLRKQTRIAQTTENGMTKSCRHPCLIDRLSDALIV